MVPPIIVLVFLQAAVAQDLFLTPASMQVTIPTVATPGGGKFPMLMMGDGSSWGRPTNFTAWLQVAGDGAGIHSAWGYGSQPGIPSQVAAAGRARKDYYLSSMIPCGGYAGGPEPMNASLAEYFISEDLKQLKTDFLDIVLLHHRCRTPEETREVWSVLEQARHRGQAVDIGVSNFEAADLKMLLAFAKEPIAVNQAHFGPGQMDYETLEICQQHGIVPQAYSPLSNLVPASHPTIQAIAQKHQRSVYQVVMRYTSQHGIAILSSTTSEDHMKDDVSIFGFNLTSEEVGQIDALQNNEKHGCADCYTIECRTCRFVLDQLGCPSGFSTGNPNASACAKCAYQFEETVLNGCGNMVMALKACGQ